MLYINRAWDVSDVNGRGLATWTDSHKKNEGRLFGSRFLFLLALNFIPIKFNAFSNQFKRFLQ